MTEAGTTATTATGETGETEGRIVCRVEAPIGWLIVDNARRRNAVNLAMWQAIPDAVRSLDADDSVRLIVVAGAGEAAFVSGADISEFETVRRDADTARAYEEANAEAFAALRGARKPTLAMIRGFCFGGGVGLAVATDMRIASDDALFSIPAGRLGVGYPPEAIRDVVKLTGPARAKDLFFTARRVGHDEALAIGLVEGVFAAAELEAGTRKLAATIAENAPLTLQAAKAAIDAVTAEPGSVDMAEIRAMTDACFDSADFAEGRAAFLEKRRPLFTGR
ncbi:enoyl-CoA hydratase/carnithine racemase [Rhodobium orientis]|uniref:Enoyl-CoA hydratase n=1 Tax=Rhodobium orientis TaxID=34017 RepID=A0A327JRC7_9HYPH|nr:enoyl-CoA hydratase [Rhodobium orientis]MBB4301706.1 enoyl-CoA hydratase/carnithine racemase [Rhodobium orientis]MBK5950509.1 enoyl-CoA hydratase [Rhodobium orientis]RAI28155.1 enoyl-CoA hydratase [Rhodobium orientis]